MTTGNKIKYFRHHFGMTQKELGEKSGLGVFIIQKYETNARKPKLEKIIQIADAMNIDYRLLLDETQKQKLSANDVEKSQLLSELHNLRIENEILKERLMQIKELTSL